MIVIHLLIRWALPASLILAVISVRSFQGFLRMDEIFPGARQPSARQSTRGSLESASINVVDNDAVRKSDSQATYRDAPPSKIVRQSTYPRIYFWPAHANADAASGAKSPIRSPSLNHPASPSSTWNFTASSLILEHDDLLLDAPSIAINLTQKKLSGGRQKESNADAAKKRCQPVVDWYHDNRPTCNTMHEISFRRGLLGDTRSERVKGESDGIGAVDGGTARAVMLGLGGTSAAWAFHDHHWSSPTSTARHPKHFEEVEPSWPMSGQQRSKSPSNKIVVRTLRLEKSTRQFDSKQINEQRIDAVVTGHLTSSPNVIDVYGYCGTSTINEYADGGDLKSYLSKVRRSNQTLSSRHLLSLAADAMIGMADVHFADATRTTAVLLQKDVKTNNIALVKGRLKYIDFNTARFLQWNYKKNHTCGFGPSFRCDGRWKRAPEDCRFNDSTAPVDYSREKKDLYYLGAILFLMLTGEKPYYFDLEANNSSSSLLDSSEKLPAEQLKRWVLEGRIPSFPSSIEESTDSSIRAVARAVRLAMTPDIDQRPNARYIARDLIQAMQSTQFNKTSQ